MSNLVAKADGVVPANQDYALDQNPLDVGDCVGPFWVSLQAWTHTDDGAAGAFTCRLIYDDPSGISRTVECGVVNLSDPTSINQTPVVMIERVSNTGDLRFQTELFGSAGSALVSWRLMISQADISALQTLNLTPIP